MTRLVEVAEEHYHSIEKRKTSVPEWGDMTIYAKSLSPNELCILERHVAKEGATAARLAKACQILFEDESGKPLITVKEFQRFSANSDADLLARVLGELGFSAEGHEDEERQEQVKNSETVASDQPGVD